MIVKRMYHNDEGRMYAVIIPDKDAKTFGGGWKGYFDVSWGIDGVNISFVDVAHISYEKMVELLTKMCTIDMTLDELRDDLTGQIGFVMEEIEKAEAKKE